LLVYALFGHTIETTDDVLKNNNPITIEDSKLGKNTIEPVVHEEESKLLFDENQKEEKQVLTEKKTSNFRTVKTEEKEKNVVGEIKNNTTNVSSPKNDISHKTITTFTSVNEPSDKIRENKSVEIFNPKTNPSLIKLEDKNLIPQWAEIHLNSLFSKLDPPSLNLPDVSNELDLLKKSPALDFKRRRNRNRSFGVHLIGGVSLARKQLSSNDSTALTLLPIRRNTETSLETSHFGLMVDMQTKSGWGFATGVERTKINERYDYETTTTTTEFIEGVEFRQIKFNGDTLDIIGTLPVTTTKTETKQFYNSYTMYDIPVIISFYQEANDWYLGVRAGLYVNVAMTAAGRIANDLNSDILIKDVEPKLFKSSVGVSYYLGMSVRKPLFDQLELSISPSVRFYPKDFASAVNPIAQKYVLFGGHIGLGYRF